jgi:hypothetical protein
VAILLESEESARAGGRRAEAALLGAAEESFVGRSRLDAVGAAVAGALAGARRGGGPAGTVFTCGDLGAEVEDSVLRSNPATAAAATARVETLFGETFGAAGALGLACAVLSRPEGGPPQTALVLAVEDDGATAVVLQMGDQGAP